MKEKILESLKNKYKNLGLGEKALEGVANILATTTTEEADIETAINGVNDLLLGIQSDADKRVNDAVAKVKSAKAPEPTKSTNDSVPDKKSNEETPEWAKPLFTELAELKSSKIEGSRKQILETKLKDISPVFSAKILKDFQRMKFESDEDFGTYLAETEADALEFAKETVQPFGRPIMGAKKGNDDVSTEEIDSIVKAIM